ncbi:MAG: hypothetical protein HRT35_07335 [Algicola sp.]|nr:hypothetical protein [Algicola sp.]
MSKSKLAQLAKLNALLDKKDQKQEVKAVAIATAERVNKSGKAKAAQKKRILREAIADASTNTVIKDGQFDIVKAALQQDLVKLKTMGDVKDKLAYKAKSIQPYMDYLATYRDEKYDFSNIVLSWMVIWLYDLERVDEAQEWAELAAVQGQETPGKVTSNMKEVICRALSKFGRDSLETDTFVYDKLAFAVNGLIGPDAYWQAQDAVKMEFLVIAGKHAQAEKRYEEAKLCYAEAVSINADKAGCKGRLATVTEIIDKAKKAAE